MMVKKDPRYVTPKGYTWFAAAKKNLFVRITKWTFVE